MSAEAVCGVCKRPECVVSCRARELQGLVEREGDMPMAAIEDVAEMLVREESRCHVRPKERCSPNHRPWRVWIKGREFCYACNEWEPSR